MATRKVYKNAYLSYGGNDISAYIVSCSPNFSVDEVDGTGMGDEVHYSTPGLYTAEIEVEVHASWVNAELDSIMWPYLGSAAVQAVIFKPDGDTTGTSNPKWTGNGRVFGYTPVAGSVGDGAKNSFTIKAGDGTMWVRATSD